MKIIIALLFAIVPISTWAGCVDIITHSKEKNVVIESRDRFEKMVSLFCSEYNNSSSSSKSSKYKASYKALSGKFGKSKSSENNVYEKVCLFGNDTDVDEYAYEQYVTSIAPGAIDAYIQCMKWEKSDLKFSISEKAFLSKEFTISTSFSSNVRESRAILTVGHSNDVNCKWNNTKKNSTELSSGSSANLKCERKQYKQPSYIQIIRDNEAASPMTIPWGTYDDNGNRIDILEDIKRELNYFSNSVIAFNMEQCPKGWNEYKKAYGRFIRGIDNSDEPIDPLGKRVLGMLQSDMFKRHNHTGKYKGLNPKGQGSPAHDNVMQTGGNDRGDKLWHVASDGGAETRPKNVSLLYCIKQ